MSSLVNDAGILRKPGSAGVPTVGRKSPFAHVAETGSALVPRCAPASVKAVTRRLKTMVSAATCRLVIELASRIGRLDGRVA
jgi:hypothetical protein